MKKIIEKIKREKQVAGVNFSKSGLMLYLKNISWLSFVKLVTLPLSFITISFVARGFGPENFGTISYILSITTIFSVLANLGIDNAVYKELLTRSEDRDKILGSSIALKFITSCLAFCFVLVFVFTKISDTTTQILILLAAMQFFTQPLLLLNFDFLKEKELKHVSVIQIFVSILSSLTKIILAIFWPSIYLYIILLSLENIVTSVLYVKVMIVKKRWKNFLIEKLELLHLLKMSAPLAIFSVSTEIYSRIDQIMIKHFLSETAVGLYSAAVKLSELWYLLPNIAIVALFPGLALVFKNKQEYNKRLRLMSFAFFITGIICITFTLTFSKNLIHIIFGEQYKDAVPILNIYVISILGSFFSMLMYHDLLLKEKLWQISTFPIVAAIINIILNLAWIPTYGTNGAAAATAISYSLIPIMFLLVQLKDKTTCPK